MEPGTISVADAPPAAALVTREAGHPRVSVVMPIYNEAAWIDRSLTAVLHQDYPASLVEILIADSSSSDGTIERICELIARHPDRVIRLLENPGRTPGAALNLMIREASGEIIVRVDGHTEIAPDYVRHCLTALEKSDALNVGGCVSASGVGIVGRAVALAIGSFWGNGGARYRSGPAPRPSYVDTVQFGAWRRETLSRLGPFLEEWAVNEDCEFNARILDAGGKILLHPAIRAIYFPRSSLGSLARQYFRYGRHKCRVIARHPRRLRARQLAPPLLVLGLLGSGIMALLGLLDAAVALAASLAYVSAIAAASMQIALQNGRLADAWALMAVFATLHVSYGAGALLGTAQWLASRALPRPSAEAAGSRLPDVGAELRD